jgi:hypothetical protein
MRYEVKDIRGTVIRSIEGVGSTYGPGGFGIGVVGRGESGNKDGQKVPGPWGYAFGLAGVIDQRGGTGRDHADARAEGRMIERLEDGDELVIDGDLYRVEVKFQPWNKRVGVGADLVWVGIAPVWATRADFTYQDDGLVVVHSTNLADARDNERLIARVERAAEATDEEWTEVVRALGVSLNGLGVTA